MSDDSHRQLDPEIADLFSQALDQSTPAAAATDSELAIVAEKGITGLPEADRERVLNAMAANRDGEIAAALLHADLEAGAVPAAGPSIGVGAKDTKPSGPTLAMRLGSLGWCLAACLALASTVGLLTSPPAAAPVSGGSYGLGGLNQESAVTLAPDDSAAIEQESEEVPWIWGVALGGTLTVILAPVAYRRFRAS